MDFVIAVGIFTFVIGSLVLSAHWASKPENSKRLQAQLDRAVARSKQLDEEFERQCDALKK